MTDLAIKQGTTYRIQWPLTNGDGTDASVVGYTARGMARKRASDEAILYSWTTLLGNLVLEDSTLTLAVDPAVSSAWAWSNAVYDIELISPTGSVTPGPSGRISVTPEVTR